MVQRYWAVGAALRLWRLPRARRGNVGRDTSAKSGRIAQIHRRDRVLLAAASRLLPRQRWASSLLVTPQTLLRWGRALVRRKWTYGKQRTHGKPRTDSEVVALVLRMAREFPVGLRADLRGAAQARHPGGRHDHQDAAATPRPWSGAATHRPELDAVSSSAS